MRRIISANLILVLLISSLSTLSPLAAADTRTSSCENGGCVPGLIERLKDLGTIYKRECLPKGIKEQEIEKYYLENGLSETCWKYITEINHLESQLISHQNKLEARLGCQNGDCKSSNSESLNSQINALSKVEQNLSCTEPKKKEIRNQCPSDMTCVLAATAMGVGGYLAELIVPEKTKPKNCHLGNDSCLTQLATGFLKSAITFFESAWDLLKIIGKKSKEKMSQFWDWVSGAEDHSSTSQLAMAKASEDDGVFDMLLKDFSGTMKKIWSAFVGATKEWMKTSVFCQKWSGVPQFSQCLQPTESFDCIPCKTMVTGLCSVSGTLVAEIVPAFLTGGLLTAAKHGVNGAGKISKLFKVSKTGMNAVKNSRVGKMASSSSAKIDDVLKASKSLKTAKTLVDASLGAIKAYFLTPTRKLLKTSFTVMNNSIKKGGALLAETPAGKVLVFSGKTFKTSAKVILYPIDNPLTTFAYKAGARSFDKVLKLGSPTLGTKTIITSSLVQKNGQIETTLAKLEKARMSSKPNSSEVLKLEEELLSKVENHRQEILRSSLLKDDTELSEIIKNLYPELQYGDLAKKLPQAKVLAAENEVYLAIQRIPENAWKETMLKNYKAHTAQGPQRAKVLGEQKTPFEQKITAEKTTAQANFNKPLTAEELALKKSIDDYMDAGQKEMMEKASKTEKLIKSSKKPVVYDVIAIGAGPNNGVAVSVLKETNPALNVLVIEASDSMGTFNKLKGFDINTPEFIGNSGNTFPGSPVQLRDFNVTDASFASAEDLGHLTVGTYKSADADMIFNNKVIKWEKEPTPGAWPAKYKIETSNGVVVYANSGIAGTGFGPPITRLKDPSSIQLVQKYEDEIKTINLLSDKNYMPKATSVDDFLTIASKDAKAGNPPMERYRGKKVLVIGSGDGGNIAVEATAGLNKSLNPKGIDTEIETIWLGQEAATGKELLEGMGTRKLLRYSRIAEGMDSGRIKSVNGYLAKVEEFVNEAGEKQFKAYYTTKSGEAIGEPLIVDNLVFATGYPNNHSTLTPIFSKAQTDEITFETVSGRVDDFTRYEEFKTTSEITKQLTINGKAEDVYATGVFAKTNITDEEWKVPTGGFLDITAPKAAATGKLIAQKLTPQKLSKKEVHQILKVSSEESLEFIKRPLRPTKSQNLPNTVVADLHTKMELGKTLRSFKTEPNATFTVSVQKNSNGRFVYRVNGLQKRAAKEIAEALSNNAELTHGIDRQFQLGRTVLDIQIKARPSGTINLENLIFAPQAVTTVAPIVVPMNVARGADKFTSPALRSGKDSEQDNKKEP